jgi:hypothetical protein
MKNRNFLSSLQTALLSHIPAAVRCFRWLPHIAGASGNQRSSESSRSADNIRSFENPVIAQIGSDQKQFIPDAHFVPKKTLARSLMVCIGRAGMKIAMSAKPPLKIVDIERLDEDTIGVSYSDLTTEIYTAEQLTQLDPLAVFEKNKFGKDLTIN